MVHLRYLAYLDPATGSTVFQIAVASAVSVLAVFRGSWKRVRSLLSSSERQNDPPPRPKDSGQRDVH
jgi:hypothetical protein